MKRIGLCVFVLLLSGLMVGVSNAQITRELMQIEIPFDYFVGNALLPAGNYSVRGDWSIGFVWFKNLDGAQVALAGTSPVINKDDSAPSSLTFNRIGNTYFLAKVTVAGKDTCKVVTKTVREKEMESLAVNRSTRIVQGTPISAK